MFFLFCSSLLDTSVVALELNSNRDNIESIGILFSKDNIYYYRKRKKIPLKEKFIFHKLNCLKTILKEFTPFKIGARTSLFTVSDFNGANIIVKFVLEMLII